MEEKKHYKKAILNQMVNIFDEEKVLLIKNIFP